MHTRRADFTHMSVDCAGPSGDQALNLLADPLGYLDRITQQHGPIVGLVLGGEYVVVVADAAAARTVLHDQSGVFVKVTQ